MNHAREISISSSQYFISSEDVDHYLWIMLEKPLIVIVSILMNFEDADSAQETSTSSNQYFFSLNSEFSIAWRVESKTRILTRLKINIKSNHKIDIEYLNQVTTLISSTWASQKVGMKIQLDDQFKRNSENRSLTLFRKSCLRKNSASNARSQNIEHMTVLRRLKCTRSLRVQKTTCLH